MVAAFPLSDELYLPTVSVQCSVFLKAVLLGAVLCLIAALLMAVKKAFRMKPVAASLLDFATIFVFSLVLVFFVLGSNDGRLRWFLPCGAALGFLIIRLTIYEPLNNMAFFIIRAVVKAVKFIFLVIFTPIKFIFNRLILKIVKAVVKIVKNIWIKVKFYLIKALRLLYNLNAHLLKRKR